MALAGEVSGEEKTPISFPGWRDALLGSDLVEALKTNHEWEIRAFLRHCKATHSPASVALARQYLETVSPARSDSAREALRWFVRAARRQADAVDEGGKAVARLVSEPPTARPSSNLRPPPAARQDLGGADWERDLIAAVRRKGFLWRTEQTYRQWANRFVEQLRPRSPYSAEGGDVAAFLSKLAVEHRASASTQKQALNALVFFLQEGLRRSLGEFDFRRARARTRVPTVMSREECHLLFGRLSGSSRLMAELMYGSGLRLMELLRLRVHHLDFERRQLKLFSPRNTPNTRKS